MREACHKQKGNRAIHIHHNGHDLSLTAEKGEGIYYRKRRSADIEPVFGNIKTNKNFKRFLLKGIDKTEIEWGLLCLADNLKKMARKIR